MKYRSLGSTGLEISEVSFGTADNAGLMVRGSEKERIEGAAFARDVGINYFETSPSFGRGAAEVNLGKVLKDLGFRPYIGTMVELLPEDFEGIDRALIAALDGSLERLGLDGIDILIVHNPPRSKRDPAEPIWKPVTVDDMLGPALAAFERLRSAGKAKWLGFATELCEPEPVYRLLESGAFSMMNVCYNLVNPSAGRSMPAGTQFGREYPQYGQIIDRARANGVGAFVFRILAGGALSEEIIARGPSARHPNAGGLFSRDPAAFQQEIDRSRPFGFLSTPQRTLPQAAYAYALMNPAVTTIVGGFSDIAQMQRLAGASDFAPLSSADLAGIDGVYEASG